MEINQFPSDSVELAYLARIIQQEVQSLEKSGAPCVSAPGPKSPVLYQGEPRDLAERVAAEKEKWGLA